MEFLETFYTRFVPIFLFTVMVAMGLSLTPANLQDVARKPKPVFVGLAAQLILLPIIAIVLGIAFRSPPVIAAGAIILAACPGGVTSNAYVFASKADIALSVGLTAIASMITVFSIPLLTLLALNLHLDRTEIPLVPVQQMMATLALFTLVPVAIGMLARWWRPELATRAVEPLRIFALVALMIIVVIGTITAWDTIIVNLWTAGILMAAINISAMSLGFGVGNLLRLPFQQMASITFEVGVQNLSMALFVCLTFLNSPELAVATLVYALIMKITALSFVWYVRNKLVVSSAS